jgi:hypothetical protein
MSVSLDSSLVVPEDVIFRELDGEAIILNLGTGIYFGLDAVGSRMWTLFAASERLDRVAAALAAEYDVDPKTLEKDIVDLAEQLLAKGLVRMQDAAGSQA